MAYNNLTTQYGHRPRKTVLSVLLYKKLAEMVRWVLGAGGVELKGD